MPLVGRLRALAFVLVCSFSLPTFAVDLGDPEASLSLEVHGFVSQGFILTSENNYLAKSREGSLEFAEVGINFTKPLADDLRVGVQLFARDLGPLGNYSAKMDWFYLDYHFRDWLGLRVGRTKLPFGLYNEFNDIDAAYAPILLPQSVYPVQQRDYLLAQTGAELYGRLDSDDLGGLDYRLYGGTILLESTTTPGSPLVVRELTIPYVVGGRLTWEMPIDGLRIGGSLQALRLDTEIMNTTTQPPATADVEIPALLWVASAEYANEDLLLAVEYSRWDVSAKSSNKQLFPEVSQVSERGYAMFAYRLSSWFQPSAYYSLWYPNMDDRSGRESHQRDIAVSARFDINEHWLFKLEGHYMEGTAGLRPQLNDNVPQSQLTRHWGVFLAKTTAYF